MQGIEVPSNLRSGSGGRGIVQMQVKRELMDEAKDVLRKEVEDLKNTNAARIEYIVRDWLALRAAIKGNLPPVSLSADGETVTLSMNDLRGLGSLARVIGVDPDVIDSGQWPAVLQVMSLVANTHIRFFLNTYGLNEEDGADLVTETFLRQRIESQRDTLI